MPRGQLPRSRLLASFNVRFAPHIRPDSETSGGKGRQKPSSASESRNRMANFLLKRSTNVSNPGHLGPPLADWVGGCHRKIAHDVPRELFPVPVQPTANRARQ